MIELITTALLLYCGYKIYSQHRIIHAQAKLLVLLQTSQYVMEEVWKAEEEQNTQKETT